MTSRAEEIATMRAKVKGLLAPHLALPMGSPDVEIPPRRVARLRLQPETGVFILAEVFRALPKDAQVDRAFEDYSRYEFHLWIRSAEFPEVERGSLIPEIQATLRYEGDHEVRRVVVVGVEIVRAS